MSLRLMLGASFVLALGAAVIVFVSPDDVLWLRLGIAAALWAALMSAFAVSRSRRDAQAVAHREAEITRTYELELHREVTARREYESSLKQQVRDDVEQQNAQELKALRAQLDRLTDTLSSLLEGDVQVERLTLSADARRMRGVTDAQRGRITQANRSEIDGPRIDDRQIEDPDQDAVDAEVVEDGMVEIGAVEIGAVEIGSGSSPPVVKATPDGSSAQAPETAWASRHRQHVQQAAAVVAADAEARRRAGAQQQERRAAQADERAAAEVDAQRRTLREAAAAHAREEAAAHAREEAADPQAQAEAEPAEVEHRAANAPRPGQAAGIPHGTFSVVARGPEPMPWPPGAPSAPLPAPPAGRNGGDSGHAAGAPDTSGTQDASGTQDDHEAGGGHANDGTRRSVADLLAALGDGGDSPRRRRRAAD